MHRDSTSSRIESSNDVSISLRVTLLLAGMTLTAAQSAFAQSVLYNFQGTPDGANPVGSVVPVTLSSTDSDSVARTKRAGVEGTNPKTASAGAYAPIVGPPQLFGLYFRVYGTTQYGGSDYHGTVFSIDLAGNENVVYSFQGGTSDGANPTAGLSWPDSNGNLYGVTGSGGANGGGIIFSLNTNTGIESLLHSFAAPGATGGDGWYPSASPTVVGVGGTTMVYGSTLGGGKNGIGMIWSLNLGLRYTDMYDFNGVTDGGSPMTPLISLPNGLLAGAANGGSYNPGVVFTINPTTNAFTVLHSFSGGSSDGGGPTGITADGNGNIYGLTTFGCGYDYGCFYEIPAGGVFTVLHNFAGPPADGASAAGAIYNAPSNSLFLTTFSGGTNDAGVASCFNLTKGTYNVQFSFGGALDSSPSAAPTILGNDAYYTAQFGSASGAGQGGVIAMSLGGGPRPLPIASTYKPAPTSDLCEPPK